MTVNLTKTKKMVVKGKVERPLPTITFDINQEEFLRLLGVCPHSNPRNRDKQIDAVLSKAGRRIHILRVCKKPGYSLDFLQHLFHGLIIPIFTYGISVLSVSSYDKYLSKIDKFRKEQFVSGSLRFWFPLSLLESSDNKLWKNITTSTEGPLVDLLPPSKTSLLRNRGHSYILYQIRTERFKRCFINRCLFNFI